MSDITPAPYHHDGLTFEERLFKLIHDELAANGVNAVVTGYVLIAEGDRADDDEGAADLLFGFEPLMQKRSTTFGLLDIYTATRHNRDLVAEILREP
jgi:hypothetical protein